MRDTLEENVMVSKLIEKIQKTKAPICVGLDPMLGYIPEHVKEKAFAEFGETLEGAAEAIWQFNCAIVDATADLIPAVKPQIAMYEQFGIEGLKAYDRTVKYCQQKGLIRHRRHQARRHRFHIGCLRNRSSRQREGWKYDLFCVQYRVCDRSIRIWEPTA
ncbi:MAG: hypothetical protein ACLR8P_16790 [Clostridium fessum]